MNKLFFQSYFSQKSMRYIRLFVALFALSMPFHGYAAPEAVAATQQKKKGLSAQDIKKYNQRFVAPALQNLDCAHIAPSILGRNEWDELLCDDLVEALDAHTKTSFGRWAIRQMLWPVGDREIIEKRQETIKTLVEDDKLFAQVNLLLKHVAECEDAYLSYFDNSPWMGEQDPRLQFKKDSSYRKVEAQSDVKNTYFTLMLYRMMKAANGKQNERVTLVDTLNSKTAVMEGCYWFEVFQSMIKIVGFVGLNQLWDRMQMHVLTGGACGGRTDWGGLLKEGFTGRVKDILPFRHVLKDDEHGDCPYSPGEKNDEENEIWAQRAYERGWLGDRARLFADPLDVTIPIPFFGEWKPKITPFKNTTLPWKALRMFWGYNCAFAPAAMNYYILAAMSYSTVTYLWKLFPSVNRVHEHMVRARKFVDSVQKLGQFITRNPYLRTLCMKDHVQEVFAPQSMSSKMKSLLSKLKENTFKSASGLSSVLYMRGRVLAANDLFTQIKEEFAPALRAIGELDAYHAIASQCRKGKDGDAPFSFVELVESDHAIFELKDAHLPSIIAYKDNVKNDIMCNERTGNKFVITGPNGCGKSTYLKVVGQAAVMGHSFGVVPASHGRMTIFTTLCTSLRPDEDVHDQMSSFMAQKASMDGIVQTINQTPESEKIMFLGDELYRGTVGVAAADMTYEFGQFIKNMPHIAAFIATHVQRPIDLERDTGKFKNLQVEIAGHDFDTFDRTFRITPGPSTWWFGDRAKRDRFFEWLKTQYKVKRFKVW